MYPNQRLFLDEIETTAEIDMPKDPIDRVIGQDNVIDWLKLLLSKKETFF